MRNPIHRVTLRAIIAALLGAVLAASACLAALASTAGATGTAPPWEPDASSVGALVFYDASGHQVTSGNLSDSPVAAYVLGTGVIRAGDTKATLYGYLPVSGTAPGTWNGDVLGSSTVYPNTSAPAPLNTSTLPVETGASDDESIATLIADWPNHNALGSGYENLYQLRLKTTKPGLPPNTRYDSADISINSSAGTWTQVYPAPTATTLTASPTGSQASGGQVTLTATLSSSSATGTVQFENGTTPIGSPQTVTGGMATVQTSSLPVGTDTLYAVFTPASGNGYLNSTGTLSYEITSAPAITSANSATFTKGTAGSFTVTTTGFPTPTVNETGTLPTGVTFAAGVLSGTPTVSGSFPITCGAANGTAPNATQAVTLTVLSIGITTTSLPSGSVYSKTNKVSYSATLAASGGNPPYKWSLVPGSTPLPPGLKLSSKGVISGKAKTAGTYDFTVQVVDKKTKTKPPAQNTATATLSITIG